MNFVGGNVIVRLQGGVDGELRREKRSEVSVTWVSGGQTAFKNAKKKSPGQCPTTWGTSSENQRANGTGPLKKSFSRIDGKQLKGGKKKRECF